MNSKTTPSTTDPTVSGAAVADKTITDAAKSKIDQVDPNATAVAPTSPATESKKRPLETDDSNALEEKAVKAQKLEADSEAPANGENKKRSRNNDEAATNEGTETKLQKTAADDES